MWLNPKFDFQILGCCLFWNGKNNMWLDTNDHGFMTMSNVCFLVLCDVWYVISKETWDFFPTYNCC
jgi:hypothetical protein